MGNKINLQIANDLQTQIVTKLTGLTLNENIHILNIRLEEEKNDYLNTIVVDKTKDHNNEKQTMVILHGYGAAATVFYRVFKGLGENFRLLIVDLYGFGQSTRIKAEKTKLKKNIEASENYFTEPIEQWRQQMGINEKFILVGHSFGGYVASAYALKYPQNIQKLMLLSPAGFSKFSQQGNSDALNQNQSGSFINRKLAQSAEYFWNKDISAFDLFRKLGFAFTAKFVDSFLKQNSPDISKEEKKLMKQYLTQIFLFPSSGEYAVNQLIHANGQTRDCLLTRIEQIRHQVPITFVYGDTDWMHGQKEVRDRDHRVVILENSGHQFHFKNPTGLTQLIINDIFNSNLESPKISDSLQFPQINGVLDSEVKNDQNQIQEDELFFKQNQQLIIAQQSDEIQIDETMHQTNDQN